MRLFLFTVLLVLTNMSFAQSVWDQYPSKSSTPVVKEEPVRTVEEPIYSVPAKVKIEWDSGHWYAGSRQLRGKSLYSKALILSVVGGAALGWGISSWIADESMGKPLTIGGGVVALVAIVLGGISGSYTTSAVEIYNKSIGYDTSLQIKIAPTPQGGAALAFAF